MPSVPSFAPGASILEPAGSSAHKTGRYRTHDRRRRDERLDRTAASRTVTISSALARYENALQAARSLWLASGSVSRQEFSIFARSLDLDDRYPGLQGIGWRSVVTDDEADEFVARTRKDRAPGFTITPPGRRPVYYVTLYSYPRLPFSDPLGADARANPGILASLEQARATGETTVSNQTTLAGDFLTEALTDVQRTTGVELHDEVVGGSPIASFPSGFRAQGPYVREERFTFGGRSFVLRYAPLPGNAILTERPRWC
jgi:hypothetical protein